ncbi:MAG TPA: lysoplasmalogenase [Ornithinibacter sp.]|nr:lysoplasmalogenase [Ornithinibacter sp.]
MSYAVWVAALVTAALFAADWWAVWHRRADVERLAKPAAMVGLFCVALLAGAADSTAGRWLLLALVLGLVGDVLLLEDTPRRFVGGLAAFLVGHLAYVASFVAVGLDRPALGWLGVLVLLVALVVGRRILPGAVAEGGATLGVAVAAYMAVIGAMAVTGWATGRPLVGLGASLFVVSDTALAMGKFVQDRRWTGPLVIVTYHLAQVLIVAGLLS